MQPGPPPASGGCLDADSSTTSLPRLSAPASGASEKESEHETNPHHPTPMDAAQGANQVNPTAAKLTPPLQAKIREVCAEYDERNDHDEYLDARAVLLEALDRLEKEQAA